MPLFHPLWIWQQPSRLLMGIPFSVALMAILLAHEFGHFLLCEKYEVNATLPVLHPRANTDRHHGSVYSHQVSDPFPPGAVRHWSGGADCRLCGRSPAAAGWTGIVKASDSLPWWRQPGHRIPCRLPSCALDGDANSRPQVPLSGLALHPIAVAAWVGMFATALNLLPGGQLDGGHIIYAVAPRAHKWVSRVSVGVLALLSCFWIGWLVWAVILGVTGWRHPPVPAWPELDSRRRMLSVVPVILLALTIVPAPILDQGWF